MGREAVCIASRRAERAETRRSAHIVYRQKTGKSAIRFLVFARYLCSCLWDKNLRLNKKREMTTSLQVFLIASRTKRGLSQQELANVAQVHISTIGKVERGDVTTLSPRIAAMIGRALHEVERLDVQEISDFLRLTNISGAIFNTPPESESARERKLVMPVIDRLIASHGMVAVLNLLHSIEQFTTPRAQPQEEPAEEEPPILKHVTPPRYRPDLGGTEQIITQYQAAKPPAKKATPLKRKGTR